jgi:hypothetical protein
MLKEMRLILASELDTGKLTALQYMTMSTTKSASNNIEFPY